MQNRCARLITNNSTYEISSSTILSQLSLMNINQRKDYFIGISAYKCMKNSAPFYLSDQLTYMHELHGHNTRNKYLLQIPHSHTNVLKQSFSYNAAVYGIVFPKNAILLNLSTYFSNFYINIYSLNQQFC